jgi:hypothetical protein
VEVEVSGRSCPPHALDRLQLFGFVLGGRGAGFDVSSDIVGFDILGEIGCGDRNSTSASDLFDHGGLAGLEETAVEIGCLGVGKFFEGSESEGKRGGVNEMGLEEVESCAGREDSRVTEIFSRGVVLDLAVGIVRDERPIGNRVDSTRLVISFRLR